MNRPFAFLQIVLRYIRSGYTGARHGRRRRRGEYGNAPTPMLCQNTNRDWCDSAVFHTGRIPMIHAAQATSMERIAALRDAVCFGIVPGGGSHLHGELFCDLDGEIGNTSAGFNSALGSVLEFDVQIEGQPRWVVLRLELGEGQFHPGDVLGLVVRGSASLDRTCQIYLRMVRDGGFTDTRFADSLRLAQNSGDQTVMHTLSASDPACGAPGSCAIILGLPTESFRIQLADLHFFVMPAEEGLRSMPIDMSSFAA